MVDKKLCLVMLAALVATLMACAPRVAPVTAPAPVAPQAAPASPASAASVPEDNPWARIVASAKKEGRITLYAYNFTGDMGIALGRAFEEKYGIKVEIITGRGAEFLERLKTERRMGRVVADWIEGSPVHLVNMKMDGLTVGGVDTLPVFQDISAFYFSPFALDPADKRVAGYAISVYSPYVNVNLVKKGEEPRFWRDLLEPRWKGKMMLADPRISSNAYLLFVPLLREKVVDEEYLKALYRQELNWVAGTFEEIGKLAQGQFPLSVRVSDSVAARPVEEGAPIRAIDIEDGVTVSLVVASLLDGPHPNAAKLFMNWLFTPEGQAIHGKLKGASSFRKDTKDFRPTGVAFTPKRPVITTNEDSDNAARWFRDRWLDKLWGR